MPAQNKHIALANELRKEVLSGRYGSEGGLPVASEIAKAYSVTINTVNLALNRLEGEGIVTKRGAVFYVNSIAVVMTSHVPLPGQRLPGRQGYVKTLRTSEGLLPPHIASTLGVSPESVFTREQVAGEINGHERPLQLSTRYYFLPLTPDQRQHVESDPNYDPMWEIQTTLHSHDEVCSRQATVQEAKLLNIPDDASVLAIWEVIKSPDGTLLMAQTLTLSARKTLIFDYLFENK